MVLITKYRIYCTTDSKWEYIWNTTSPTTCPTNGGHIVNANSVSELAYTRRTQIVDNLFQNPYTITGYNFYRCDTTSSAKTINLKSAAKNKDRVIIIQNYFVTSGNNLTIDPNGSELIDGALTKILSASANYNTVKIQSNGTGWIVLEISTDIGDDKLDGTLYEDNFVKGDVMINNGYDITNISGTNNTFLKINTSALSGLEFVTETVLGDSNVAANAGIDTTKLADGTVTNTEFQYINSLTSNAQTQIDLRIIGPITSTDNAILKYDGTTGKVAQNTGVIISDTNDIYGLGYIEIGDITAPGNPTTNGFGRIYKKTTDPGVYWINDSTGIEQELTRASKLTPAEVDQLANIDAHLISNTQWGYLSALDQNINAAATPTFDGLSSTNTIDMNLNKILNLATPTANTDAATKEYVDGLIQGLDIKESAKVATVIPGDLALNYENGDVIDGITLVTNDIILIKNQTNSTENGIYKVNASGAPTRILSLNTGANAAGTFTFVEQGTVNEDSGWVCTSNTGTAIVGTNNLIWTQFSGAGQIIAGNGLSKTGNTLDVNVDASSIIITADTLKIKNAPQTKGAILTFSTEQISLGVNASNNYNVLIADDSQITGLRWGIIPMKLWVIQDRRTLGTNGGTATANSWLPRQLNTIHINLSNEVTLASNILTINTGTYHVNIQSCFYRTNNTKIRLYNITNSITIDESLNIYAASGDRMTTYANIETYLQLTGPITFRIDYICDRTQVNDGLGFPNGIVSTSEIYTNVTIKKL